ncbi:MAG: DNA repair protein RecO [Oscillospiraceae bacterium]|nr:DNA repair protein RecO [Oscillospiraceae bacterium]
MFIKTKGIVLRETSYQEQDKLLTVLTENYGKLTVRARGAKSTRNTMKAAYQLMAYSEMTLMEQQGRYVMTEAVTKELFSELQEDIELLSLSSYFLQVTEAVAQEEDPEPELLSLLMNVLYALGKLKMPQALVKMVFELRLCCVIGFLPALEACGYCEQGTPAFFHIREGRLSCANCAQSMTDGIRMPLSPGALEALRYICYADSKKIFSFRLASECLQQLSNLSEAYLCAQLERGFYTLDFYKTLLYGVKL